MKRFLTIALAATTGLVIASSAFAALNDQTGGQQGTYFKIGSGDPATVGAYTYGLAANGIQAARHNLGSMGARGITTESTSEICVFCHTPHHTLTALTNGNSYAPAPIWNRKSVAASFIGYGTTIGGTFEAGTDIGGVTLACLSCHDGVTTFDNIVNAPGSGLGAGGFTYGDATKQGWTFYDGADLQGDAGSNGRMSHDTTVDDIRINIGYGSGQAANQAVADLSNDHPMSICYSDGQGTGGCGTAARASLRNRATVIGEIDLISGLATTNQTLVNLGSTTQTELIANLSQNRWAVKGFISGNTAEAGANAAVIADLLRIGKVECSSCHDPHFKNRSNVDYKDATVGQGAGAGNPTSDDVDGLFLRRVGGNAGSGVCRTCHNK